MNCRWKIILTEKEFRDEINNWIGPIACDTETAHDKHLLGVSLSPSSTQKGEGVALYVPFLHWDKNIKSFERYATPDLILALKEFLAKSELIGHSFTYDKKWANSLNIETNWIADTRIMWHLSDTPASKRPYGLKNAQVELLGWNNDNEEELKENVRSYGGNLSRGEHYLADLHILSKYACLDAYATISVANKLKFFFDDQDYWPFLKRMMDYNELLELNTELGVAVNIKGLTQAHEKLLKTKEAAKKRFLKILTPEIEELERDWVDEKISKYKRESNKTLYTKSLHKWKRFNLNSDSDKRDLLYGKMGLAPVELTDSGIPSTSSENVSAAIKASTQSDENLVLKTYLKYEKANTLSSNFTGSYLPVIRNGRIHPRFDICGTVSYRLSGFKPYLLNAPFNERLIYKNFKVDEGWIGIHADLTGAEPCITAHYTEDPTLVKVYKDGLGDVYLDLALKMFPNNKELQENYYPLKPITKVIKEQFKEVRDICKTVHLATQYTGTKFTISKNLCKAGYPTTTDEADRLVKGYWKTFEKVKQFNNQLESLHQQDGHVRNVVGRIIKMPWNNHKDLPNRFFQSGGHDVLVLWVSIIYKLCASRNVQIRPVVVDIHDSTSNSCPIEQRDLLKEIYKEALQEVNRMLELSVEVKMELKEFRTLAGLKSDE